MTTEPTPATAAAPPPSPPEPATPGPATPEPTTADGTSPTWILKLDYFLLLLVLLLSFFVASFTASNSDLWTHFAIGKRLSEGTFQFGVDPFSWATEGIEGEPTVRWVHHAWLYSWFSYVVYDGWRMGELLVVLKAICFTIAITLLSRIGWSAQNRWFLIIGLLMAALAASPRLQLEPTVISFLFLAITLFLLDRAGAFRLGRADASPVDARCLWGLPPMFALWANLDAWFILGPIVVGLCWLAAGMARWFPATRGMPMKTLGLVFAAGLLACVLNPNHVYVFQLPSELAYLVVAIADPIHLPLPDALVGGGRTLKELRRLDPDLQWTMSPITSAYYSDTRFGKNIAGIAFYPLVLLGLIAFTLMAMVKPAPNAPSFHVGRFLLWLVFGVMALTLHRLIPFFVLVAAPMTALTLGEFLAWQQANAATPSARRDRGLNLARLVSIPFCLLLLYLAWPGWLHGPTEFNSRRRVAWQIREDASLRSAALTLQALKDAGEGNHVFNADRDFGNVLPWFAPDVKHGIDTRFPLFARNVTVLAQARDALNGEKSDADWRKLFADHDVDQIAMVNFISQRSISRVLHWWLAPQEWRQRYGDLRIIVFSRAPAGRPWPRSLVSDDLNRRVFGPVPLDQRPPATGVPMVQPPSALALYLDGIPPTPGGLSEIDLLQERFGVMNKLAHGNARPVRLFGLWTSLVPLLGMPDGMRLDAAFGSMYAAWALTPPGGELGPPAAPIQMVRIARRAVAENPLDHRTHLALLNANETTRRIQEDRWIGYPPPGDPLAEVRERMPIWMQTFLEPLYRRPHPAPLRDRVRQCQHLVGAYNIVQLQPDSHFNQDRLAKLYLQERLLDFALEHMQIAEKVLELERPSGGEEAKKFEAYAKAYREEVANLDKDIKQRLSKWKELSTGKSPFAKARLAMGGQYLGGPLALGKKAIEMLDAVDLATLAPEERLPFDKMRFDLMLSMGRADWILGVLDDEKGKQGLPTDFSAQYRLFASACLGNYDASDEALAALEQVLRNGMKGMAGDADRQRVECAAHLLAAGTQQSAPGVLFTLAVRSVPGLLQVTDTATAGLMLKGRLCNDLTLQGILLIEAGHTTKARQILQKAMSEGPGNPYFTERPIASRYLELLEQQKR